MKTKLFMLLAAVLLTVGATNIYAQEAKGNENGSNTGSVTLNIKLNQIQSLVVNKADVDLIYDTKTDYKNGVFSDNKNHLTVYSTGGFEVKVKASDANLNGLGENNSTIKTADVLITPTVGSSNPLTGATLTPKNLSGTTDVLLVSSDKGGVDKNFDIQYKAAGGDEYIDLVKNKEGATTYTTTVTYTITAK